jgi:hypothetical protein
MPSSGISRRAAVVRADDSEEGIAPILSVTRIRKLLSSQEPHDVTSQKTAFFIRIIVIKKRKGNG